MRIAQTIIDAMTLGSLYALFALGVAQIFGVMRLVNFAHGELVMVGGYALVLLAGWPLPLRLVACVGIVILFALAMERLAFRPLRGSSPLTLLVASLAVSFFLQNLAILFLGARPKSANVADFFSKTFQLGALRLSNLSLVTVATTAVLLLGLAAFFSRTRLGIQMRAAAEDFRTARLLGIRANTVIPAAFAISGILAAAAAILLVGQTGTVGPRIGISVVVVAFIATILGGMGSLTGAVLAGFFLGAVTVLLQAVLPLEMRPYRDAFGFAVVLAVLVLRPQGLIVLRAMRARV